MSKLYFAVEHLGCRDYEYALVRADSEDDARKKLGEDPDGLSTSRYRTSIEEVEFNKYDVILLAACFGG